MPPRRTTTEPSEEVAAATRFDRFKEFPDELQIMIWAEALPRAAVQYITVSLTSELDSAPRYLHGRYITTMAATRADLSKSMWWQRDNIEQSDAFCPRVLSRWLQQLGHLKTLYVICKLGQLKDLNKQYAKTNCWVMDKTDRTSGRVTSGHKRSKKNATEMLLTVMQIFKETARHEELEMYEDAQTTFYEVRPQDSGPLAIHGEIWPLLRETNIATQASDAQAGLARAVQYKLLVGCDWKSQALKQVAPGMGG